MYVQVVKKVIQEQRFLTTETVEYIKSNLSYRCKKSVKQYNDAVVENIFLQLYKYADIIYLFEAIRNYRFEINHVDLNKLVDLIQRDCNNRVNNLLIEQKSNLSVWELKNKYINMDIREKEYDYLFISLMYNILLGTMDCVLYGKIETTDNTFPIYSLCQHFTVEENITALNYVIVNEITKFLFVEKKEANANCVCCDVLKELEEIYRNSGMFCKLIDEGQNLVVYQKLVLDGKITQIQINIICSSKSMNRYRLIIYGIGKNGNYSKLCEITNFNNRYCDEMELCFDDIGDYFLKKDISFKTNPNIEEINNYVNDVKTFLINNVQKIKEIVGTLE